MAADVPKTELLTPLQLASALQDLVIRVEVEDGVERRAFHVHTELLKAHSSWFETQISPLKFTALHVISVVDIVAGLFNLFVYFIYNQSIPRDLRAFCQFVEQSHEDEGFGIFEHLMTCDAFVLAEQLGAPSFHDAVSNYFVVHWEAYMRWMSTYDLQLVIEELWDKVPKEKVILQFLVDQYCLIWNLRHSNEGTAEEDLPRGFLLRCMKRFSEMREVDQEWQEAPRQRCYFTHASEDERQNCAHLHMRYDDKIGHGFFE